MNFLWRDQQNNWVVVAVHLKWGPNLAKMPYLGPSNCKLNILTLQIGALVTILSPQLYFSKSRSWPWREQCSVLMAGYSSRPKWGGGLAWPGAPVNITPPHGHPNIFIITFTFFILCGPWTLLD